MLNAENTRMLCWLTCFSDPQSFAQRNIRHICLGVLHEYKQAAAPFALQIVMNILARWSKLQAQYYDEATPCVLTESILQCEGRKAKRKSIQFGAWRRILEKESVGTRLDKDSFYGQMYFYMNPHQSGWMKAWINSSFVDEALNDISTDIQESYLKSLNCRFCLLISTFMSTFWVIFS